MARKSMGSRRQHLIAFAAMLGLLVGGIAKAEAASYTFTKIADSTGIFSSFGPAAVNDRGVVAFPAVLRSGLSGMFTGEGNGTTTIADSNSSGPFNGGVFFFISPSLSKSGVLAFRVRLMGVDTIVRTAGSTPTTIAQIGSRGFRFFLGNPSINDSDTVAFFGFDGSGSGIFTSDGATPTTIAHTPTPFSSFGENPSLSDGGTVAFLAFDAAGKGIFRRDGTTTTTIAHTSDPLFSDFAFGSFPSLNNEGTVAFLARLVELASDGSFVDGIFVSNGTTTTTIADSRGPFLAFGNSPSINDKGVVAFWARHAGGDGIFTGPNPSTDNVIAAGDDLDESTVMDIRFFGREGLNNAGQVAFVARFVGGRQGVYRADPVPSEPEVLKVSIDIKPGGNPNSINPKSQGTVPIAILGTADFDATTVKPTTVTLAGVSVKLKKNGMPMAAYEDANGDGRVDLVVHVSTQELVSTHDLQLGESSMVVVLTGQTYDGMAITGSDTVRIVP